MKNPALHAFREVPGSDLFEFRTTKDGGDLVRVRAPMNDPRIKYLRLDTALLKRFIAGIYKKRGARALPGQPNIKYIEIVETDFAKVY